MLSCTSVFAGEFGSSLGKIKDFRMSVSRTLSSYSTARLAILPANVKRLQSTSWQGTAHSIFSEPVKLMKCILHFLHVRRPITQDWTCFISTSCLSVNIAESKRETVSATACISHQKSPSNRSSSRCRFSRASRSLAFCKFS